MAATPHKCANRSSIDIERSRLLDDVGGSHFLCVVTDPQGDEVLALVDEEALDGLAPFRPDDWRQMAPARTDRTPATRLRPEVRESDHLREAMPVAGAQLG